MCTSYMSFWEIQHSIFKFKIVFIYKTYMFLRKRCNIIPHCPLILISLANWEAFWLQVNYACLHLQPAFNSIIIENIALRCASSCGLQEQNLKTISIHTYHSHTSVPCVHFWHVFSHLLFVWTLPHIRDIHILVLHVLSWCDDLD